MTKVYVSLDSETKVLLKEFLEALCGIEQELEWIRKALESDKTLMLEAVPDRD